MGIPCFSRAVIVGETPQVVHGFVTDFIATGQPDMVECSHMQIETHS